MIAVRRKMIAWLTLPVCLIFSLFLMDNTFAEDDGSPQIVCRTLVSVADTSGEWSPGVTICARSTNDGGVVLVSVGLNENYLSGGTQNPNIDGISNVEFKVYNGATEDEGVSFSANGNAGTITVKKIGWWSPWRPLQEKTFEVSKYSDPYVFVKDVMDAAKGILGKDTFERTKRVAASGGITIAGAVCTATPAEVASGNPCKSYDIKKFENKIRNAGYEVDDCVWDNPEFRAVVVSGSTSEMYDYSLVCGGTPAHNITVTYTIELRSENQEISEIAIENAKNSGVNQQPAEGTDSGEVTCMSSGAASSGGWFVCWVMEWLSNAADGVYKDYVEPALYIEPALFQPQSGSSLSAAQEVWDKFRNIANILFVILLLIVIFSQITGYGIDNYGIKKIMPKLIVAAVMINVSYIICLIFVDLSNIIGNGIQGMLNGMGSFPNEYSTTLSSDQGSAPWKADLKGHLVGAGILAAFTVGGIAVIFNPAILLSLLVSALSVAISVFFLFILLAAREAAVIVLVIIAPLAVVCYMLPNTKKYFDRWVKMFSGLLLLYPICGLLVSGGNFVSKLLLTTMGGSNGGFFAAFIAMVVGVAPIFFIPTVLKNSFAAMGNLGATISGLGKQAGSLAASKARNSGVYKNAQQAGLERQTRIRAGIGRDGQVKSGWRKALGAVASGGNRSRQRNALQYQRMVSERGSLEAVDEPDFMLETDVNNEMKRIVASGEINDEGKMQSELTEALKKGDRAKICAYTDALTAKGESGRGAVRKAYDAAVGAGMSSEAAKTFAANIMSKHALDYKNNNRAMYEVANSVNSATIQNGQFGHFETNDDGSLRRDGDGEPIFTTDAAGYAGGRLQTTGNYASSDAGKVKLGGKAKASTLAGMDDQAFAETFLGGAEYDKDGAVDLSHVQVEALNELGANAYSALQNSEGLDTRRSAYLRKIVEASGYRPEIQTVRIDNLSQTSNSS